MNNSADILRNHSAGSLGFASVSGGLQRHRDGRTSRLTRDFVPSSNGGRCATP